jgi:hypothetical protein
MIVFSPRALAASNRCRPSTSTKRAPSARSQDRRSQAVVKHARGDFVYAPLIKGGAPFDWHVDVCDRNGLALHRAASHHPWVAQFTALLFFRLLSVAAHRN